MDHTAMRPAGRIVARPSAIRRTVNSAAKKEIGIQATRPRQQLAPRRDSRVEEVQHDGCGVELLRAPRHRRCGGVDVTTGEGKSGASETEMPATKQVTADQARQLRILKVD